jgi:hypothetical protein
MSAVYLVHHAYEDAAGCDEVKLIGAYSSESAANAAVERLRKQPGFRDRPNDFHIEAYDLDKDHWTEGYVTGL